jgi:hypothetical protein
MNALKKISDRAKQLRRKNSRLTQTEAIKKAAKEYRAGKLGKVSKKKAPAKRKKPVRQKGSSNRLRDMQRKAKPPGIRRSKKTGRKYFENRKNRSDLPGKLTGFTNAYAVRDRIERDIKTTLANIERVKQSGLPRNEKTKSVRLHRQHLSNLKRQLREQNSLINKVLK